MGYHESRASAASKKSETCEIRRKSDWLGERADEQDDAHDSQLVSRLADRVKAKHKGVNGIRRRSGL
jgi:hypothetical protein